MSELSEKTPFAITLKPKTSLENHTGAWRTLKPAYAFHEPPCSATCPAGERCRDWLFLAENGDYLAAWAKVMQDNPFPATMGRVCYHTCEGACNRGQLDEPVGINSVERFLGDEALKQKWKVPAAKERSGRKVLIVGSGPAGLSAAYHLALLGHEVTVLESSAAPGGMMRYGIPKYRLPRAVLDAEIQRIADLGVRIVLNHAVQDLEKEMEDGSYDAVFLGVGAQLARRTYIPAGDSAHILDAVSVLRSMEGEEKPQLGRRVVVYGGGNTAVDVARSVRRMGAEPLIVYRRTRQKAPAHSFEIEEAAEEGVSMKWLSTIADAEEGKVRIEKMVLDEEGNPKPTGEYETITADSVVLALGQETDLGFLDGVKGLKTDSGAIVVDQKMMTTRAGIFAGGDAVKDVRNVTVAIGHGKRAARAIDCWLRGTEYQEPVRGRPAAFESLNTWYFADAPKTERPLLDIVRRQTTFEEVLKGLTADNALYEARRCMSCGNCFECDNCYGVCPDNAIVKLGPGLGYQINYDFCKGCGICANECPCGAIDMKKEDI
ncbi:NAD(P)-binding protein [Mesosutterella sp. OilRF-GAM-744-9]|uniref:NAD(P)-binding protein n=1 Tax=Mesosutterella porci TaxID=2915351 RepID=A0ABS9MRA2_9BURK|nr:NAD(P)-binding protein [Mesosutterella sp. oilRF-744-WT-GAM-9]MCG5031156.1 NAD(P)-binding protein [Mesosutterella sp. oilRF-744-WT-GAM-9]